MSFILVLVNSMVASPKPNIMTKPALVGIFYLNSKHCVSQVFLLRRQQRTRYFRRNEATQGSTTVLWFGFVRRWERVPLGRMFWPETRDVCLRWGALHQITWKCESSWESPGWVGQERKGEAVNLWKVLWDRWETRGHLHDAEGKTQKTLCWRLHSIFVLCVFSCT